MATAIRPIHYEERLTLVEHLDELRTRLIISGIALALAFGICFWQNHALLSLINRPIDRQVQQQIDRGDGFLGQAAVAQQGILGVARDTQALAGVLAAPSSHLPAGTRRQLSELIPRLQRDVAKIPATPNTNNLITLGVGEPFTTTVTVVFIFALILSLPVILYELYGFVLPALNASERRAVRPLLMAVPFLFVTGVAFGYFVVMPAAIHFLQNFNSDEFNVVVQASQYYEFAATVLLAMGLVFQVPVVIVGATRVGLVTPHQLRRGRRFAIVACAAVAAFLPGDAITLLLETAPLYVLYEVSILVAAIVARREARAQATRSAATAAGGPPGHPPGGTAGPPSPPPGSPGPPPAGGASAGGPDPAVSAIINHIDRKLSD